MLIPSGKELNRLDKNSFFSHITQVNSCIFYRVSEQCLAGLRNKLVYLKILPGESINSINQEAVFCILASVHAKLYVSSILMAT